MTPQEIILVAFKIAFGIAAVCFALTVFLIVLAI
jgi:hypothetical protein